MLNKGEWSELYVFFRLLSDAKLYAADENVNKINDVFYPIVKLVREENINEPIDYFTGNPIQIFKNDKLIENISKDELIGFSQILFKHIVSGDNSSQGSFDVPDLREFLKKLKINKIKASSQDKSDINVQLRDIYTGFTSLVGFSIKSDVGSPSTLLNAGKNTRIRYVVKGLSKESVEEINSIDKNSEREYMKARMVKLFEQAESITFDKVLDETFNDNLIMIDSLLPRIYGEMILLHYKYINKGINDCEELLKLLEKDNPIKFKRIDFYRYKFKRLLCASALGMTPGKFWDGLDKATGGYIIVKRNGDVLAYHLYNRNYFEEYLLKNTQFDRPSATKFDYGYLYEENGNIFIDLNIQIRFLSISRSLKKCKVN